MEFKRPHTDIICTYDPINIDQFLTRVHALLSHSAPCLERHRSCSIPRTDSLAGLISIITGKLRRLKVAVARLR